MPRPKRLIFKEILGELKQATNIIQDEADNSNAAESFKEPTTISMQSLRSAATQAQQAATDINRLIGIIDAETDREK